MYGRVSLLSACDTREPGELAGHTIRPLSLEHDAHVAGGCMVHPVCVVVAVARDTLSHYDRHFSAAA
jgi:hypothetical protein